MNKVYKVVWSKVKNCYVVASEMAKSHTKSPKSCIVSRALVAGVLACVMCSGIIFSSGVEAAYTYQRLDGGSMFNKQDITGVAPEDGFLMISNGDADNTQVFIDGERIIWQGSDWSGVAVPIGKGSTYVIHDNDGTFNNGMAYFCATTVSTSSVQNAVTEILRNEDIGNYNAGSGVAINNKTISAKAGTNVTVNANGISVNGTGSVASGNTGLINGNTAYNELRPANGNYIAQNSTTALNLSTLDTQTKRNTDAIAYEKSARESADNGLFNLIGTLTADGNYIKKDNNVSQNLKSLDDKIGAASVANGTYVKTGNTVNQNLKALDNQTKANTDAIMNMDESKANRDASNVAEYAQEWADAIGKGTVTADDTRLVTGKTVYDALHDPNMEINVKSVTAKTINGDNVTVNKNLNVLGDTHLEGDLNVDGKSVFYDDVTMKKNLDVDGKATVGSLEVEGNGKVNGNWQVLGNQSVEGNSHIYGNQTVDGKSTVGSQEVLGDSIINGNQTIKKDTDMQGNAHVGKDLTVDGNASVGKDLHVVGESKLDGNVTMGSDASVAGDFSVAGNTTLHDTLIDGTLEVNKESTFHDNVAMDKDLDVAGNANIGKDLTVEGISTLKGDTFMQSNAEIGKDLHVKGTSQLDGNTTIGTEEAPADLVVTGNATVDKNLMVKGDSDMQGNANIGKDLTVEGVSTLKGDTFMQSNAEIGKNLHVKGTSALDGDVVAGSNLTVKKDTYMEGNAEIGKDLHVKGTLQLDGNTTIGTEEAPADLYVTGNTNIGKNLTVEGTLDVMDNTHLHKDLQVDGNTNIGGNIHIGGDQIVDGDSNIKGNQTVEKNLRVEGDTNIGGNTVIQKDLTVEGDTYLQGNQVVEKNLNVNGDTTIAGNTTIRKNLTVDGDSHIKGNQTVEKNLSVLGDTNIAGNTVIEKNLTVNGDSHIKGNQVVDKDLSVNGNANIHGNGRVDQDFSVGGNSDFEGNVRMQKDLKVDGNASVGGTLVADRVIAGGKDVNREIGRLDDRIDSAGAHAAALAGLHPTEFDEGQKWNVAAAYGNYKGSNAGAVGLFYRPDENTTLNVAGSFGDDDGMFNAGVSLALGKPSGTSRSALKQAVKALKADNDAMRNELEQIKKQMSAFSLISNRRASFPDVPADHWANDAVETLRGNNMVQGYPDGTFKGDKPMTRYEYAEMLYNALSKGANVKKEHVRKYAPEIKRLAEKKGDKKMQRYISTITPEMDARIQEAGKAYNEKR